MLLTAKTINNLFDVTKQLVQTWRTRSIVANTQILPLKLCWSNWRVCLFIFFIFVSYLEISSPERFFARIIFSHVYTPRTIHRIWVITREGRGELSIFSSIPAVAAEFLCIHAAPFSSFLSRQSDMICAIYLSRFLRITQSSDICSHPFFIPRIWSFHLTFFCSSFSFLFVCLFFFSLNAKWYSVFSAKEKKVNSPLCDRNKMLREFLFRKMIKFPARGYRDGVSCAKYHRLNILSLSGHCTPIEFPISVSFHSFPFLRDQNVYHLGFVFSSKRIDFRFSSQKRRRKEEPKVSKPY